MDVYPIPLMKIELNNRQTTCHPNVRGIKKLARQFMDQLHRLDRETVWNDISIVLMDDAGITDVNHRYLNHAFPTDVICFRYLSPGGNRQHAGAEIIVNVQRALVEGPEHGGTSRELALYIAHGCDHLSELNDNTAEGHRKMRLRELRWLSHARKCRLLNHLVRED